MARTRHDAVVVGLLACLLVALIGVTPVVGQLAGTSAPWERQRGSDWVPLGHAKRIAISGTVRTTLSPGVSAPVELRLLNANPHTVRMRRIRVKIATITAPHADAAHPCTRADFRIRQMPKRLLKVRRGINDLTRMRVPKSQWPYLTMVNRPVNQDGCKDAHLTLRFRAHRVRR